MLWTFGYAIAASHEGIEDSEHFRVPVEIGGRTVQLQEVERIHLKVAQAVLDPQAQVRTRVAFRDLGRQLPAGLGRDPDRVARPLAAQVCDQPLAATIA